jgi:hypothetical protein
MNFTVNIPDYLNLRQYKEIQRYEHLEPLEKMAKVISILSDKTEEEIITLSPSDVSKIYLDIINSLTDVDSEFYPIFELEGVKYGYTPINKMTLAEYIDLKNLSKDAEKNIEEIIAILYRPIINEEFNSIKYAVAKGIAVGKGELEDLFQYYTIEKYDSNTRRKRAKLMQELPASFALGVLSFFLQVIVLSLKNTPASSLSPRKWKKELKTILNKTPFQNTGVGLALFTTYRKVPSLQSQEIKTLQI